MNDLLSKFSKLNIRGPKKIPVPTPLTFVPSLYTLATDVVVFILTCENPRTHKWSFNRWISRDNLLSCLPKHLKKDVVVNTRKFITNKNKRYT